MQLAYMLVFTQVDIGLQRSDLQEGILLASRQALSVTMLCSRMIHSSFIGSYFLIIGDCVYPLRGNIEPIEFTWFNVGLTMDEHHERLRCIRGNTAYIHASERLSCINHADLVISLIFDMAIALLA
jgi:hypothetical protein